LQVRTNIWSENTAGIPANLLAVTGLSLKLRTKVFMAKPERNPKPMVYKPRCSGPTSVVSTNPNTIKRTYFSQ
jgi:hypothetical protein